MNFMQKAFAFAIVCVIADVLLFFLSFTPLIFWPILILGATATGLGLGYARALFDVMKEMLASVPEGALQCERCGNIEEKVIQVGERWLCQNCVKSGASDIESELLSLFESKELNTSATNP